jgi:putative transcriptional regulator
MRNRLRVLRVEAEWSQAALAERLGVSRQTVNAIETGRYDPSLPLAFAIGAVFGRPIEELFFPDGSDDDPHGTPEPGHRDAGRGEERARR